MTVEFQFKEKGIAGLFRKKSLFYSPEVKARFSRPIEVNEGILNIEETIIESPPGTINVKGWVYRSSSEFGKRPAYKRIEIRNASYSGEEADKISLLTNPRAKVIWRKP